MGTHTFVGLNSTAWSAIYTLLTAGLLAVAVIAAIYAKRQWRSAREQIEESRTAQLEANRPYVTVTVEPSPASRHLFDLVVKNIGERPAFDVSITLDPPPVRASETDGHELSKAKMLNDPVTLAPNQELRAFCDSHLERDGRDDLLRTTISPSTSPTALSTGCPASNKQRQCHGRSSTQHASLQRPVSAPVR